MLILPFAYHVEQLNACQQGLCTAKRFKSKHLANSAFDIPVILLNQIVQILALPDGDDFLCGFAGIERGQGEGIGATFIDGHHFGLAVVADGFAEVSAALLLHPFWR
ncbi:hypothetical protein MKleb_5588 (plasmid) [Klebsiella sp. PL-2018]|nr:hypothetical protein MKleb_5588 [Klebsiella sp. PL-2018]